MLTLHKSMFLTPNETRSVKQHLKRITTTACHSARKRGLQLGNDRVYL